MKLHPKNPGRHQRLDWKEKANGSQHSYVLAEELTRLLAASGYSADTDSGGVVTLAPSGFQLIPCVVSLQEMPQGFSSCCTVQVNHPVHFPDGAFEYAYSMGHTIDEAMSNGLSDWIEIDLAPLLLMLEAQPKTMTMLMELPDGRNRRVIMGPTFGFCKPEPKSQDGCGYGCPCCLFMNSIDSFHTSIQANNTFAIRLLGMKDPEGNIEADCRINGEEYEIGKEALRQYARTWTSEVEMRKQTVIIHTVED